MMTHITEPQKTQRLIVKPDNVRPDDMMLTNDGVYHRVWDVAKIQCDQPGMTYQIPYDHLIWLEGFSSDRAAVLVWTGEDITILRGVPRT